MKYAEQINFSGILFDTLFGLILFFSLDSFFEITDMYHLILYVFTTFIIIHWWLEFKSVDDTFGAEVNKSLIDLLLGAIYIILIELIVFYSKIFDFVGISLALLAVFTIDLIWSIIWRYVGKWETKDIKKIKMMEMELDRGIKMNSVIILLLMLLIALIPFLTPARFVIFFITIYLFYAALTFRYKIIDIRVF